MSYIVRFVPEAQEQLAELEDYIAHASGSAETAARYVDGIVAYCESLDEFPERGTQHDDLLPGLRLVGFRRRATIAFTVNSEEVTILGVFYGGQDIDTAFRESED